MPPPAQCRPGRMPPSPLPADLCGQCCVPFRSVNVQHRESFFSLEILESSCRQLFLVIHRYCQIVCGQDKDVRLCICRLPIRYTRMPWLLIKIQHFFRAMNSLSFSTVRVVCLWRLLHLPKKCPAAPALN